MAFQQFGGNKDLGGLFDAYTGALSQGQQYVQNQLQNDDQAMQNLFDEYRIPMELRTKAGEAAKGDWYASPEGQTAFGNVQTGQGLSQLSAGQKAQALLPFVIAAEKAKAEQEGGESRLFANMYNGIEKQYDQSLDPNVREAGGQGAYFLADTLSRVNPKNMSQERILGEKLGSADLLNLRNNDTRLAIAQMAAQAKQRAVAGDKTAQQALITMWKQQVVSGEITQAEYGMLVADLQTSINAAKVQPGITPVVGADGDIGIGNKPIQQPVQSAPTPQTAKPKKSIKEY